jgi:hypothetical protein
MSLKEKKRRQRVEIGLLWSLVFIPIMFVGAGLSLPYTFVTVRIRRRQERALRDQMQAVGRVMEWSDFVRAVVENRGTFVEERYSLKGPDRWWWTEENVYDLCPYPTVDWLMMVQDEHFLPIRDWFHRRYTSVDTGQALLVATCRIPREEINSFWQKLKSESGNGRWIEVGPPPETSSKK